MSDFIKGLWPRSWFTRLGLILGALSVLKLVEVGFNVGLGPVVARVVEYYELLARALISSWAEPLIAPVLVRVNAFMGWNLRLDPIWKHLFILMWLYFGNLALGYQRTPVLRPHEGGLSFFRRRWSEPSATGIFLFLWGGALGFCIAVAAGSSPVGRTPDEPASVATWVVPIIGFVIFEAGRAAWFATTQEIGDWTWLRKFHSYSIDCVQPVLLLASVALAVGWFGEETRMLDVIPNRGLLLLATFVVAVAAYETIRFAVFASTHHRRRKESWWQTFSDNNVGLAMLRVVFWTTFFLVTNAGLGLIGL